MTSDEFKKQMTRLKSEWPSSFGEARQLDLWDLFKGLPNEVFHDAVTQIIRNGSTYPPRGKDFNEQVELARGRWKEREWDRMNHLVPPSPPDTEATPERRARVHEYVQQIVKGLNPLPPTPEAPERRAEELREQLRVVSGRDRAAGEKESE